MQHTPFFQKLGTLPSFYLHHKKLGKKLSPVFLAISSTIGKKPHLGQKSSRNASSRGKLRDNSARKTHGEQLHKEKLRRRKTSAQKTLHRSLGRTRPNNLVGIRHRMAQSQCKFHPRNSTNFTPGNSLQVSLKNPQVSSPKFRKCQPKNSASFSPQNSTSCTLKNSQVSALKTPQVSSPKLQKFHLPKLCKFHHQK